MKISVQQHWSFEEALIAAWEAYSGGQQFGSTNRIRVLEQWANIVGQQRALREFEDMLAQYKNIKDASENLGLSEYAIRKLRKSFKGMPIIKEQIVNPNSLFDLLKQIPRLDISNELIFISQVVPTLAKLLGYRKSEIYFEPNMLSDKYLRPDAIISPHSVAYPYIIL